MASRDENRQPLIAAIGGRMNAIERVGYRCHKISRSSYRPSLDKLKASIRRVAEAETDLVLLTIRLLAGA